ncbi:aminoglycoside phosphotransferase family protein [Phenylobacterium sp. 20VBR1]|uniref:Aminoglycoside phosphotransferase family protein n=1 Tax=Phenylobacterium glaciei TaxID=2803784 RepID=A0A941D2G6_9CAUL|nr:aminoglycoside phosphotransferase family protein [Phenylobacterium glaciei]MBR7620347.1 aminoglycoside phosphotransferase family protein [Phenylobacterium glaciei]
MTETKRIAFDADLARRLVATQFPQWAHLPVRPVVFGGKNNTTFHLGDEMSVRLPSARHYVAQVEKEQAWLPRLAPQLPLPIPEPVGLGAPGEGYPWPWSVYRWIEGETAALERIADLSQFARDLAAFLTALQAIDVTDGPVAGQHNFFRGGALSTYDAQTRQAIIDLGETIDGATALSIWEQALAAECSNPPVWLHGDVAAGNLLVKDGRLSAVIDFGILGVGDPACDLAIAWTLLHGPARAAFREALPLDEGTWARGRGWTIWKALIVAAGLSGSDDEERTKSRAIIADLVGEHR